MENLALKVIYKGKIIIIGKGIRTEQSIVNHLQKRFNISKEQINLFSLQYEDDAQNLNEAYLKTLQKGKQSVRIKIQQMKPQEKLISQTQTQPKNDTVLMLPQENDKGQEPKSIEQQQSKPFDKMDQKEEPHVLFAYSENKMEPQSQIKKVLQEDKSNQQKRQIFEEKKQDKVQQNFMQEKYFPLVAQISQERINLANTSELQSTEVIRIKKTQQDQGKQQDSKENENNFNPGKQQISPLLESKESSAESEERSEKESQKSQSGLLQGQQKPDVQQQIFQKKETKDKKIFDQFSLDYVSQQQYSQARDFIKNKSLTNNVTPQLQYQNQKQDPNYYLQSIVPQQTQNLITQTARNIRTQLQNQFYKKLQSIQQSNTILVKKHKDLQLKYEHLLQKYQSLQMIVQQYMVKNSRPEKYFQKEQEMDKKPEFQGYKKIPFWDPAQEQEQNQKSHPQVQIQDLQTRTQIQVGQVFKPQFFLVNTGKNKWPKNVVVVSQNMQSTPIKSLEPNGQFILEMKTINIQRAGQKIKRTYRLGYYNKKGDLKMFGRRFGVNIVGIDRQILRQRERNAFNYYINELMVEKGINGKNLNKVIENLRSMMINESNYKQADRTYLAEIIKYM